MRAYTLSHLEDHELLRGLAAIVARDRVTTAALLAHLAECDERKLFAPAGYASMHAYCVHELRMSEDVASKRIHAARAARDFPAILAAVAEGRLHLSGVCLLAPHLTRENANELLLTAAHQTRAGIELLIAQRFPRSESLELVPPIPGGETAPSPQYAPGHTDSRAAELSGATTDEYAPGHAEVAAPRSTVKPHAHGRFALHLTIGQDTYDKLEYARGLLGHALPSGDLAQLIDRALDGLVVKLEKQKFGATGNTRRSSRRASVNPRHIPAAVKRAVWQRDQGQCAFVSETGQRCESRKRLEFDHIDPVARGGEATVEGIRLLCRAHNQYEAECTFGAGFMSRKREETRSATSAAAAEAHFPTASKENLEDVISCLRQLKFNTDEAHRAANFCMTLPDTSLEARIRATLKFLAPRPRYHGRAGTTGMPA